ncbi:hypothetical protein PENTCL1PPCAC_2619 [Pristionchus entomophagus]|uniref:Uncharacterized protein n=1 Tax=Pristionchus entomophagus TaxID=358040 RepID=A0AAV5SGA6_9BILA|nr:hypothetical protein PENTCL1PPCAC_2619 [Pristionchus entomophagus]
MRSTRISPSSTWLILPFSRLKRISLMIELFALPIKRRSSEDRNCSLSLMRSTNLTTRENLSGRVRERVRMIPQSALRDTPSSQPLL